MSSNLAMPPRRRALRLAGGAATASAGLLLPSPAGAALAPRRGQDAPRTLEETPSGKPKRAKKRRKYAPGRYRATKVLPRPARHLVNRFSFGITPELAAQVRAAGSAQAWFDRQLATAYDGSADGQDTWWPGLELDAATIFRQQTEMKRNTLEVASDIGCRTLARRLHSPRPVLEVMTKFWENHLHVPLTADNVAVFRAGYGEVVRAGALGRYDDLLAATVLHPAMLMYLGNASSTKAHPNENLGRELLELHTVGVGQHTEEDVKNSARILTGWRIKLYSSWEPYYGEGDHWTGPVRVLGFSDPNSEADGRALTRRYLSYLAHHPATARRIATKLVKVFVADEAPAGLVKRLAAVYLANDTQIRPVLRALVRSPEFKASVDRKVRDADDDVVAAHRMLGVQLRKPRGEFSHANQLYWQSAWLGLAPLTWPRPDGQPLDNRSWSSPTRVLASVGFHWELANRTYGTEARYPRASSYLPERSLEFRDLVDHVSRRMLHRPSTETLLRAACLSTGLRPRDVVTAKSPVFGRLWPSFATTFLDSPTFFQR